MRIVCFSDTHTQHGTLELPSGDVLLFAGDGELKNQLYTLDFKEWLAKQPHPFKVVICGNHDFYGENRRDGMKDIFNGVAHYLENEFIILPNGMKLWGSPWTQIFFDWAFMKSEGELKMNWRSIPDDTDILLTHGPAYGRLDIGRPRYGHVGDKALLEAVHKINPKYHVFGHIHGSYGKQKFNDTQFINCSVLDEDYQLTNEPIVIDI